jgi:chaperonin GroEL (HSP60 family)
MPDIEILSGFISPLFVNDAQTGVAELDAPCILIHGGTLPGGRSLIWLLEKVRVSGRSLLVIGEHVSREWLRMLVTNARNGAICAAAITAPKAGNELASLLEGIAEATSGLVFSDNLGINFDELTIDMMGTARMAIVGKSKTRILGAARVLDANTVCASRTDAAKLSLPKGTSAGLPPFRAETARRLLVSRRVGEQQREPPTERADREYLAGHFRGIPNDALRHVRHEIWGNQIRRGPRRNRRTAE